MTERKTVEGAYAKMEGHEALCAERYANIHSAIDALNRAMAKIEGLAWWIIKGGIAVALALMAWMAVQLYTGNNARLAALEHPAPAAHGAD